MNKRNSDPFLAQTTVMLAVLVVMYALGNDSALTVFDHLWLTR